MSNSFWIARRLLAVGFTGACLALATDAVAQTLNAADPSAAVTVTALPPHRHADRQPDEHRDANHDYTGMDVKQCNRVHGLGRLERHKAPEWPNLDPRTIGHHEL